jgi:hypothetical protein
MCILLSKFGVEFCPHSYTASFFRPISTPASKKFLKNKKSADTLGGRDKKETHYLVG